MLCFTLALTFGLATRPTLAQEFGPQLEIGHQAGTAPGLHDGFSHFGAFIPLRSVGEELLIFNDSQLLLYNDQSELLGANIGFGARKYNPQTSRILGANVYYDLRQLPDPTAGTSDFHQVGFGIESLGEVFDFRAFGNVPTSLDRHTSQLIPGSTPQFGGPNGQNIIYGYERFRQALGTLDLEGGALLFARANYAISAYGGAYHLWGDNVSEWGTRGRMELRAHDKLFVNGFIQNDPIFNTTGGVSVELRIGIRNLRPNSNQSMPSRLADPVQRRRHITIHETDQELLATIAGQAITVRHVDSSAAAGGDGSIWHPNNHLADASNQSEDIVYLHSGSLFDNQQVVISSDGQRLLGEGVAHMINSDQGSFLLPGVNPSGTTPRIQNSISSPAVTINADNVEVSGITASESHSGIYGYGVSGFDINRNTLTQNGIGIDLRDVNGTGAIRGNVMTHNDMQGVFVGGNLTGEITDNIASKNWSGNGIYVEGNFSGLLSRNTANENLKIGIFIFGSTEADVTNNVAQSNSAGGIVLFGTVIGNVTDNTLTYNGGTGLDIRSDITGNITNNVAERNGSSGISVLRSVNGNINHNQMNNNVRYGMYVGDNVTGDLSNNTATNNDDFGLLVSGSVIGNIEGNNLSSNFGGLLVLGDVLGAITDNTGNNNYSFGGLEIHGVHQGILSGNTANNNGNWGIFVGGNQIGDVENNIANNNGIYEWGIRFGGSVTGNLTANKANGNVRGGIWVYDGVSGDVAGNVANDNGYLGIGGEGIRIEQNVGGSFVSNTTNSNTGLGTLVSGNINLDFINNTANNNGGNGLQVDGTIGGASSPNTASGNGGINHAY